MSVAADHTCDHAVRGWGLDPFAVGFQAGAGADVADDAVGWDCG
jgi:hypothetical protein